MIPSGRDAAHGKDDGASGVYPGASVTSDTPNPEEAVGAASRRLGRYTLHYRIAQGGMASVYLAQSTSEVGFAKWVAIKMIHPHIASDPVFVQMFLNEARLAARLDHPNLCSVFDSGETGGRYYLAMDYLHGETLGQVSRNAELNGGLPYALAARIIADAARGLHSAHETRQENGANAGVVHRDVSPQNLFVLYTGVAKVVDFGIARSNDASGERTATGILKGKLAYMSPEQIQEQPVDRRTDLWALGVVLWEVTTGQRLFKRPSDAATLMAVLQDKIPLPSTLCEDYPQGLEAIVMKAIEREPTRRYQTGTEMARALESWLAGQATPAGTDEVSDFMHVIFADRIAFRDQLLHPSVGNETVDVVAQWGALVGDSDLPPVAPSAVSPRKGDRARSDPAPVMELSHVKPSLRPSPRASVEDPGLGLVMPAPMGALLDSPLVDAGHGGRSVAPRRAKGSRIGVAGGAVLGVLLVLGGVVLVYAPRQRYPEARPFIRSSLPAQPSPQPPATTPARALPEVALEHRPLAPVSPSPLPMAPAPAKTAVRSIHTASVPTRVRVEDAGEPVRPGYLNLTSDPPVEVFFAGRSLGMSPIVDHPLPPGHQSLRLVPRDGREERTVLVDVHSGESVIAGYQWQ